MDRHKRALARTSIVLLTVLLGCNGATAERSSPSPSPSQTSSSPNPVIVAAGDIACDPDTPAFNKGNGTRSACRERFTAELVVASGPAAVLVLGDNQYDNGALDDYRRAYATSWGRFNAIVYPIPGNHEYGTPRAVGYFAYFGERAGSPATGYYSFDIGAWHLVALNSNCGAVGGCARGSPQERWLRADLASHSAACTLAFWHHPRFSSGLHGDDRTYDAFWRTLYDARADVVLVGHDHHYERFAPQDVSGRGDPVRGIREFVVGTGGRSLYPLRIPAPNSEVRNDSVYGILQLTLRPNAYDWRFVPEAGKTFGDAGSAACH